MQELYKTIESDYLIKIQDSDKIYNQILQEAEKINCDPVFLRCIF